MATRSMTGFARVDGRDEGATWYWELRSVNGRGLDVRMRLPPGAEQIEIPARERVAARLSRGNISLNLTQRRVTNCSEVTINQAVLDQILALSEGLRARLDAPPLTVEGLLGVRGILEVVELEESEEATKARAAAQLRDLDEALEGLIVARSSEGQRLSKLIEDQLERIAAIIEAVAIAPARQPAAITARLQDALTRLMEDRAVAFDAARLHQEALILATKADVEEELQRLRVHVAATHELLAADTAVGRRLDFLTQEFNREANTLCSKSNDSDITRLGLELKAVIDQMREQVQNIE